MCFSCLLICSAAQITDFACNSIGSSKIPAVTKSQLSLQKPEGILESKSRKMKYLQELFENNRQWAEKIEAERPGFFRTLAAQQSPEYLWIGCADSRVPANEI